MKSVKSIRIPDELLRAARHRARKEHVDESDALRHLLGLGAVEYSARLYERGEVTVREAAHLAGLGLWDMLDEIWKRGIGDNLTAEDAQGAIDSTMQLYDQELAKRRKPPAEWVVRDSGGAGYKRSRKGKGRPKR
jgi:predicted HTH domain antitoxin